MKTIRESATSIVKMLQDQGFEAYFCGGWVRDSILGISCKDIDIATSASPEEVEAAFPDNETIHCGKNFLVCRVKMDTEWFEVATFRKDGSYTDGRHPESVSKATLFEDAERRDLTMNALYYNPEGGEYVDPTGQGVKDIQAKTIRFVGAPKERIFEDHIRILRVLRFCARFDPLNFDVDLETLGECFKHVDLLKKVPAEAIREELNKGLSLSTREKYFDLLSSIGVFQVLIPEVEALSTCEQSPTHHPEGNVYQHVKLMLSFLELCDNSLELIWAVILHDIAKPHTFKRDEDTGKISNHGHAEEGEPIARNILNRLRFSSDFIDAVCWCVKNHMRFHHASEMRRNKLVRFVAHKHFPLCLKLHYLDCKGSNKDMTNYEFCKAAREEILAQNHPTKDHLPIRLINGADLIKIGYKTGAQLGAVLNQIREKQLNDEMDSKEQALEYAVEQLNGYNKGTSKENKES